MGAFQYTAVDTGGRETTGILEGDTPRHVRQLLRERQLLPITVDADTSTYAWSATLRLSERFSLTLYDAAYLELAQRRSLPLATLDRDLRTAAPALNIELLGA